VHSREPETRPLSHLFRREERLEDVFERLRLDARSGVGHLEADVDSRLDGRVLGRVALVDAFRARTDRQRAAARHCVAGVDGEIDDDLLELAAVGDDRRQERVGNDADLDLLADQPREHRRQAGDDLVQVERDRLEHLMAREREQLMREARSTAGSLLDL
jgi:hypothetical protein